MSIFSRLHDEFAVFPKLSAMDLPSLEKRPLFDLLQAGKEAVTS